MLRRAAIDQKHERPIEIWFIGRETAGTCETKLLHEKEYRPRLDRTSRRSLPSGLPPTNHPTQAKPRKQAQQYSKKGPRETGSIGPAPPEY